MRYLDAVTDLLNKLFNKAQDVAPTVWQAALHQVAINARISLYWGIAWTVITAIALVIALGIPVAYIRERRTYRTLQDAASVIQTANTETRGMVPMELREQLSKYGDSYYRKSEMDPSEYLPMTAGVDVLAWLVMVGSLAMALTSYWNAWQMSQNPTWWAIQLLKAQAS